VSELFANYFETVVGLTTEELKTKSIYSTTNKQRIGVSPQEILYVVIAASICKQLLMQVCVLWEFLGATDQEELL
jgi:hypothetical protein